MPSVPITSSGKVVFVGGGAVWLAAGFKVTTAVAYLVGSLAFVAVIVVTDWVVIVLGAV